MNSPETTKTDGAEVKSEGRRALLKKLDGQQDVIQLEFPIIHNDTTIGRFLVGISRDSLQAEFRQQLITGQLATGNLRPHHEDIRLLGGSLFASQRARVAIVLLIRSVKLQQRLIVFPKACDIARQRRADGARQKLAVFLDDLNRTHFDFCGHSVKVGTKL